MKLPALVDITADLLRDFRHSPLPADRALARLLAEKRFLGSHDRRFVGDTFFHTLRHLRRIDEALASALEGTSFGEWVSRATGFPISSPPNDLVWARPGERAKRLSHEDRWVERMRIALAAEDRDPGTIGQLLDKFRGEFPIQGDPAWDEDRVHALVRRAAELLGLFARPDRRPPMPERRYSFPDWIWGVLGHGLPAPERATLAEALNQPAPVTLRVNTLRVTVEAFAAQLSEGGVPSHRGTLVPGAILLEKRAARGELPGEADGWWEFQDEGSQFITEALDVRPGMSVIDACAGAGGKTLHLAQRMDNHGRLRVHEPSEGRLENLDERVDRAGVAIVERMASSDGEPAPEDLADIVLIDAPCSGSGTIRRSPDLKWRLRMEEVAARVRVQTELLTRWSRWVKPGGVLAYATCSLLREENGDRVAEFLAANPAFRRAEFPPSVPADARTREGDVQLYPHRHGTDGFFLAALRREG